MVAYAHEGGQVVYFVHRARWQTPRLAGSIRSTSFSRTQSAVFSAVEYLTLEYDRHNVSSEWNREANHTHWCELLGSFENVKTLRVEYGLVEQVSRALQPGEGESPTELLPELQELSYAYDHSRGRL